MIRLYQITNYKSLGEQAIPLSALNLFTGVNSAGKTSAIHALLSSADNLADREHEHLAIARHLPSMTFNEVRNYLRNAKDFAISLFSGETEVTLEYTPADDALIKTRVKQRGIPSEEMREQLSENLYYLPAMRSGKLDETSINSDAEKNVLGLNAEFIIDYFQNHRNMLLEENLLRAETKTLEAQVNYWLSQMTGYRLTVNFDGSKYMVRFIGKGGKELMPFHVGTGVSYITQVIIVALAAPKNCLIIVENPEIHLHPSAQAAMIDFLSMIASTGRQVIVESHSDHIFNGIRRLLHAGMLQVEKVQVINFTQDGEGLTHATPVVLSQNGGIPNYVPGLFDQFDEDLDSILS